jgi:cardiolipin synthase
VPPFLSWADVRARLHLLISASAALALGGCAVAAASPSSSIRHAAARPAVATARAATGGGLSLITEPQAGISPILSAITGAHHQVDLVMYEDTDAQVDGALADDVRRGVNVRVLLNGGYYGAGSPQNMAAYAYLKAHQVSVRWTPSYFALTHQKTLIVDGRAYILTFNFTPAYYASSRDFGVLDTIPADDAAIMTTFNADWDAQRITAPTGEDLVWSPGSQGPQVNLINSAHASLDVDNEEMDSPPIETALERAARRGVDVRITMTADASWDSAFTQLAKAGVHIHLYAADASLYIHAKMILTPTQVFLGSENFSTSSLDANRELGLITTDPTIRASLLKTFDGDYAGATPYSAPALKSGGSSSTGGGCTVTAAYSSAYSDWDVYVNSHADDASVTVTDSAGTSAHYHTSSDGDADVYLKAPESARGETVTAHAGSATCTGTL